MSFLLYPRGAVPVPFPKLPSATLCSMWTASVPKSREWLPQNTYDATVAAGCLGPGSHSPSLSAPLEHGRLGSRACWKPTALALTETLFSQVLWRQEPEACGGHTPKGHSHLAALLLPLLGHLPQHRAPAPAVKAGPGSGQVRTCSEGCTPSPTPRSKWLTFSADQLDASAWDQKL